jgi:hypothetical protein
LREANVVLHLPSVGTLEVQQVHGAVGSYKSMITRDHYENKFEKQLSRVD